MVRRVIKCPRCSKARFWKTKTCLLQAGLKILILIRMAMTKDIPSVFSGIVEVDETYLGGQWKNKRLKTLSACLPVCVPCTGRPSSQAGKKISILSKRGRGMTKQPAFGILCRGGQVWAEMLRPKISNQELKSKLKKEQPFVPTLGEDIPA